MLTWLSNSRVPVRLFQITPLCLALASTGCGQVRIHEPIDNYGPDVGYYVRSQAEPYKSSYVEARLEDEELLDVNDEAALRGRLEVDFESSVATLFAGKVHSEEGLHQVLTLVRYSPELFSDREFDHQLKLRSHALWDLALTMRIENALGREAPARAQSRTLMGS